MSDYLAKAIKKLKPNAEWSFSANDYSTINWVVLDGTAPSQADIDEAIDQIKADEIAEAKTKSAAKSALLEKLGISEDEAKLLLS